MGFLSCNRSKRQYNAQGQDRLAKKARKWQRDQPVEVPRRKTIEDLPAEILQMIFVQSANFSLPQASPITARKLRRNRKLEMYLILGQLDENDPGKLPLEVLAWAFVTRELLQQFNFQSGEESYIPRALESEDSESSLDLLVYAVKLGYKPEDPDALYARLLRAGREDDVLEFLSGNIFPSYKAAVLAMHLGRLASAGALLANLSADGLSYEDIEQLWTAASNTNDQNIIERAFKIRQPI